MEVFGKMQVGTVDSESVICQAICMSTTIGDQVMTQREELDRLASERYGFPISTHRYAMAEHVEMSKEINFCRVCMANGAANPIERGGNSYGLWQHVGVEEFVDHNAAPMPLDDPELVEWLANERKVEREL